MKNIMTNLQVDIFGPYIFDILSFAIFGWVLFKLYKKLFELLKKFDRNCLLHGVPGLKIGRFSVAGHFAFVPRRRLQIYPQNTYFLQMLMGYHQIHMKDSLFVNWAFNLPFVILHKADAFEALYSSTSILKKARSYELLHKWLNTGLLTSWGPKWKSRRKLLTPAFHFDILKDFLPVMNEHAKTLVRVLKDYNDKECGDIVRILTLCSLDIICETTLGVNVNTQRNENTHFLEALLRAAERIMERSYTPHQWNDFVYNMTSNGSQFNRDLKTLHAFSKKVIRERKALKEKAVYEHEFQRKRKALLDLLLDYHLTHEDFTEDDIQEEVDTFAFEGHDTTSMGLSWSLYLIGLYPETQKSIHEEIDRILPGDNYQISNDNLRDLKFLEQVIKESLRLYPPVPITGRQAEKDVTLCGYNISKGAEISEFIYALHRDPSIFPNPELFDPDRFSPENTSGRNPFAYVPFAAGPRNCIGQRFAMMELKIVLATVLKHYAVKSLDHRDKILPCLGLVLRPSRPIRMKFIERNEM